MFNILAKEIKLSASLMTFVFAVFGLMFFLPGYPILFGAFFVTVGIFRSFQNARETNDILFSALLPVAKKDVVKAKYIFSCFIELCSALLMAFAVIMRMTVMLESEAYVNNELMNANLFALGFAFVVFGIFNTVFITGFFKTAYKFSVPYLTYIAVCVVAIIIAESLHYIPGLEGLNAFGTDEMLLQISALAAGIVLWLVMTFVSYKLSCRRFEKVDL